MSCLTPTLSAQVVLFMLTKNRYLHVQHPLTEAGILIWISDPLWQLCVKRHGGGKGFCPSSVHQDFHRSSLKVRTSRTSESNQWSSLVKNSQNHLGHSAHRGNWKVIATGPRSKTDMFGFVVWLCVDLLKSQHSVYILAHIQCLVRINCLIN